MQNKSIMEMADDILGGVLTDSSNVGGGSMAMPTEEELPELSEGQHDTLMSHVLGEGKRMDAVKQKGREMVGRTKAYITGKKGAYSWKNQKPGAAKERTLKGDLTSVKKKVSKAFAPLTDEQRKEAGLQDRHKYLTGGDVKPLPKPKKFKADKSGTVRNADRYGEGEIKEMKQLKTEVMQTKIPLGDRPDFKGRQERRKISSKPKGKSLPPRPPKTSNDRLPGIDKLKGGPIGKPPVAKNLTTEQLDVLQRAKDILGEMTGVGSLGVNMAGGQKSKGGSHHRAMDVKLPGDESQAAAIKAASTPPVFKAKVAKDAAPSGKKKTRVIVKRKTNQSKDDETQIRVHNDMKAMYHESFDSFVDGILLKEDAGKGYPGDVSVAEFGRKGPSSDTFGGGGVRSKGRGPKIQLTKNQLMTAKKKGKGSDKDHETPGFGKASSHSRKHPQNPYAGGK